MKLYLASAHVLSRGEPQRWIRRIVRTDKGEYHATELLCEHISQYELLHESEELGFVEAWEAIEG